MALKHPEFGILRAKLQTKICKWLPPIVLHHLLSYVEPLKANFYCKKKYFELWIYSFYDAIYGNGLGGAMVLQLTAITMVSAKTLVWVSPTTIGVSPVAKFEPDVDVCFVCVSWIYLKAVKCSHKWTTDKKIAEFCKRVTLLKNCTVHTSLLYFDVVCIHGDRILYFLSIHPFRDLIFRQGEVTLVYHISFYESPIFNNICV